MRNLKRALSLTLASVMLLGMMVVGTSAAGFPDVDDADNVEAIEVLQAVSVMVGDKDTGNFRPDASVSRAEMAVVMSNLLGLTTSYYASTCPFTDVSGSYDWARGPVGAAYASKVVSGRSATSFDPAATVTAVEAAAMIMRGLGYFQNAGDYADGFNLSIVRQANKIGLFEGIKGDATTPMTRNQVAQMALNALRSEVVDFTGTPGVDVNGVTIGYRSEYTARTGTEAKYRTIESRSSDVSGDSNHRGQYYVQLGEELYDGKLRLGYDVDAFGRPARVWEYDGKDIGTYIREDLLRDEYTVAVKGSDVYDDLGTISIKDSKLVTYIDGVEDTNNAIIDKNYLARSYRKDLDHTGNGVLTQVFYDYESKTITITEINTYLAQVTSDYNERTDRVNMMVYGYDKTNKVKDADHATDKKAPYTGISSEDVAGVSELKKDDFILVTIADGDIKTVEPAEVVSATSLTSFAKGKWVNTGSQQYDFADAIQYDYTVMKDWDKTNMEDTSYNLYLDNYGYLLGLDIHEGTKNYVFITGYDYDASSIYAGTVSASAIFTDGTQAVITVNGEKSDSFTKWETDSDTWATPTGNPIVNKWFSYSVNKDNVYTLKNTNNVWDSEHDIKSAFIGLQNDKGIGTGSGNYYYGNLNTNYIIVDPTDGIKTLNSKKAIYKVDATIAGMRNVNIDVLVHDDGGAKTVGDESFGSYGLYDGRWLVAVVSVGVNTDSNNNLAYVTTGNPIKESIYTDKQGNWYWDFEVITEEDGITTKTVKGDQGDLTTIITAGKEGMYRFTYDKDGYVTGSKYEGAITGWQTDPSAITSTDTVVKFGGDKKVVTDGESIYTEANNMRGIAMAADCDVFTVQSIDGSLKVENWERDSKAAVAALAYNEAGDSSKTYIYGILNSNGEATVVVIVTDKDFDTRNPGDYGNSGVLQLTGLSFNATAGAVVNYTNNSGIQISSSGTATVEIRNEEGILVYTGAATGMDTVNDGASGTMTFAGYKGTPTNLGTYTVTLTATMDGVTYTGTATLATT